MDAAFVDIGLEKNAFLYVGDILTEESLPPPRTKPRRVPAASAPIPTPRSGTW
jgi:hypothetical protein